MTEDEFRASRKDTRSQAKARRQQDADDRWGRRLMLDREWRECRDRLYLAGTTPDQAAVLSARMRAIEAERDEITAGGPHAEAAIKAWEDGELDALDAKWRDEHGTPPPRPRTVRDLRDDRD